MIVGLCMSLSVDDTILLTAVDAGANVSKPCNTVFHVSMFSLKTTAQAPTNHHLVTIGSGNGTNFSANPNRV